jgi:hypothetical protein
MVKQTKKESKIQLQCAPDYTLLTVLNAGVATKQSYKVYKWCPLDYIDKPFTTVSAGKTACTVSRTRTAHVSKTTPRVYNRQHTLFLRGND